MATKIIFPATGEEITLDITESISIDGSSEITDFEVEEGVNISDHATTSPKVISVSGFISDVPLDATGTYDPEATGKHTEARERFNVAWEGRELLNIDFGPTRGTHENYLISSFPQTWDSDTGNGFNVSLSLKQIRIAKPKVRNLDAERVAQQRLTVRDAFADSTARSAANVLSLFTGTEVSTEAIRERFQPPINLGRMTTKAAGGALADLAGAAAAPAGVPAGIADFARGI